MIAITNIENINDFNSFISENDVCVVKFGASWCGPCRVLDETLKNLDKEKIGDASVAMIDVDGESVESLCEDFNIRNIPVLVYFRSGNEVSRSVGNVPADKIYNDINASR